MIFATKSQMHKECTKNAQRGFLPLVNLFQDETLEILDAFITL